MQETSLENFRNDIDNVKEYIKHIDLINGIEKNNRDSDKKSIKSFNEHLHRFGKTKKFFEYRSIIISLYGILETYIGIWIREHIDTISSLILDYQKKEILDVQENEVSYDKLKITDKKNIAVNLGNGITEKQEFYIKNQLFNDLCL